MNCKIIEDLLPLYIDRCCSKESCEVIKAHLQACPHCQALHDELQKSLPVPLESPPAPPKKLRPLKIWQAGLLQTALFFLSFGLIILGVALEAQLPSGLFNGVWALWLVAPATGFMLSLVNWHFLRLYKSRKAFWLFSLLFTVCGIGGAYLWTFFHYDLHLFFITAAPIKDVLQRIAAFILVFWRWGIPLSLLFCLLSAVLSNLYAKLMGKEEQI